jgi:hypothetical protein
MLSSAEMRSWHTVEGFGTIFLFAFLKKQGLELSQIKKLCVEKEREREKRRRYSCLTGWVPNKKNMCQQPHNKAGSSHPKDVCVRALAYAQEQGTCHSHLLA